MRVMFAPLLLIVCIITQISCTKGDVGDIGPSGPPGPTDTSLLSVLRVQNNFSYSDTDDSEIIKMYPEVDSNSSTFATVQNDNTTERRSLFWFGLKDLLGPGSIVERAYLSLFILFYEGEPLISISVIDKPWMFLPVTWNNYGLSGSWSGGSFGSTISGPIEINSYGQFITFELPSNAVQRWIDNPDSNYGVILSSRFEDASSYVVFATSETAIYSGDFTHNPMLTIYYK